MGLLEVRVGGADPTLLQEANFCAYWFAKWGTRNTSTFMLWHSVPVELRSLLFADATRTCFVRP